MPVNRVTDEQVKEIIPSTADINIFIDIATNYINDVLVGKGLSDARLADIELYLAAHFVALTEEGGSVILKRVGSTSLQFATPTQGALNNLGLTRFGQTALALDTTGALASAAKQKARFSVHGVP